MPDPDWAARADDLVAQLRAAPDAAARHQIIDDNKKVWGELKRWLLELSHQKCWFSEAKDCFNHWDVEHYRPKKSALDVDGTSHEGYWWLAFDWQNFRICGNAGNRKKGTYFPLRSGFRRAMPFGDLRREVAQLLDPADEDDPALLSFNAEGKAIPAADITDEWEKARVKYSVERYNLDFHALKVKRQAVWQECWRVASEYLKELKTYREDSTNLVAREGCKQAAKKMRKMMSAEQEMSAVARACILSCGDKRLLGLIQSA
jgi:uncharacterized protein (TIGR02646 family)